MTEISIAEERVRALVDAFREADERMRSLPIYNPALAVEAIGFQPWQQHVLGVLVTPWFMNFVLLPEDAPAQENGRCDFPSGTYRFTPGNAGGVRYLACSLLSPVFEFASQDDARTFAAEALSALLSAEEDGAPEMSRRDLFSRRRPS